MKRSVPLVLLILSFCSVRVSVESRTIHSTPRHVLLISIDGFDPSYVAFPGIPTLNRLIREGVVCLSSESTFPALTAPAMASLLTGVIPATHGIPANSFYDKARGRRIDSSRDLKVPTIAEILTAHGRLTASAGHFFLEAHGADIYLPAAKNMEGQVTRLFEIANSRPEHSLPSLIALYFGAPDEAGHRFGPQSTEVIEAMQETDRQIGRVLRQLSKRGWMKDACVFITSDHGMSGGPLRGSLRASVEAALRATRLKHEYAESGGELRDDTEVVWMQSIRIAFVSVRRPLTPTSRRLLLVSLETIPGVRVLDAHDIASSYASPSVWDYVLVPVASEHFAKGPCFGHGTFAEMLVPLIVWGHGIRPGIILNRARNIDVVPTMLHVLRLPIPEWIEGKVLRAAL
jgi:predicted AlkP superfamily pyrophosphatase or phosphodiesterase